jgi:hydroxyacylglutathione hydrolase
MLVNTFIQTPFQQNARIIACSETGEALAIDPGEAGDEIPNFIRTNNLRLKAIIATHGHLDHIGGVGSLAKEFPEAEILLHKDELPLYEMLPRQPLYLGFGAVDLKELGMDYEEPPKPTKLLDGGEELEIGRLRFSVEHCPGHTPGHVVLIDYDNRIVYTGDCLFNGTIGRTDFPGGSFEQLVASIKSKILTLDDDFRICCGHGPDTTVGNERRKNPFLITA